MFRLRDEKGFSARPIFFAVMTKERLDKILYKWDTEKAAAPEKDQDKVERVLNFVKSLPQKTAVQRDLGFVNMDNIFFGDRYGKSSSHEHVFYFVPLSDKFTTASGPLNPDARLDTWTDFLKNYTVPVPSDVQKFNEIVAKMFNNERAYEKESVSKSLMKKLKDFHEGLLSGKILAKEEDPTRDLVQADCFGVYIGGRNPGYLDGRGHTSPLSGARLFESAASAKTTIKSRCLQDAVVVEINAQMVRVIPGEIVKSSMEPLQVAIAAMQKKALLEAIGCATEADLEEALAARKTQKRRM